jgi:hypothetical protein
LLSVANLGRIAGMSREQIARDLAGHVHGTRRVPPTEIAAAVAKAFNKRGANDGKQPGAERPTGDEQAGGARPSENVPA